MKAYWYEDERRWVSEEEVLDEIENACKNKNTKESVFGFLWDAVTENCALEKEFLKWFFNGDAEEITKERYDKCN